MGTPKALFLALAITVTGCSDPQETYRIEGGTVEQRELISAAAQEWCGAGRCLAIYDGGEIPIQVIPDFTCHGSHTAVGCSSSVDGRTTKIRIMDSLPPAVFRLAVIHELGHALGCDWHTDTGVMVAVVPTDPDRPISDEDVDCVEGKRP